MDDSFWDEVERAKRMTGGQRMTEGLRLFDEAVGRMMAGIQSEFPDASDEEVRRICRERLDIVRRLESLKAIV